MVKKITIKEATEKGYAIDTTVYPYFGYKGPRFMPTESVNVYTELEAELRDCLQGAVDLIKSTLDGEYKPDNFTTQPWKKVLENS